MTSKLSWAWYVNMHPQAPVWGIWCLVRLQALSTSIYLPGHVSSWLSSPFRDSFGSSPSSVRWWLVVLNGRRPTVCIFSSKAYSVKWAMSDCFHPSWVTSRFGGALGLLFGLYLHCEGIMMGHIIIVAEPSDRALLSRWVLEFFVC